MISVGASALSASRFSFAPERYELGPVDRFGYVSVENDVFDVELPSGRKLPLRLSFSSKPGVSSSHFGAGWSVPLFESRVYQFDQWNLRLDAINGQAFYMSRSDRKSNDYASSDGDLKATVDGARTTINHVSGWRFEYNKGALLSFESPAGDEVVFARRDGRVTELRLADGVILLSVRGDLSAGCIREIQMGQVVFRFYAGSAKAIADQTPYDAGLSKTVSEIEGDELAEEFTFRNDQDSIIMDFWNRKEQLETLTWDSETGRIISAGDWDYRITAKEQSWAYAKIERIDADGRMEMVNRDYKKGLRERLYTDGRLERRHFTTGSGALHWKLRMVEEVQDEVKKVVKQLAYNDDGTLLRQIDEFGNTTFYERDANGNHVRTFFNDTLIEENIYKDGVLLSGAEDINGKWVKTEYLRSGTKDRGYVNDALEWYHTYDENGRVSGEIFRSGFQRKFFYDENNPDVYYRLYLWPEEGRAKVTKVLGGTFQWSKDNRGNEDFFSEDGLQRFRGENKILDRSAAAILAQAEGVLAKLKL